MIVLFYIHFLEQAAKKFNFSVDLRFISGIVFISEKYIWQHLWHVVNEHAYSRLENANNYNHILFLRFKYFDHFQYELVEQKPIRINTYCQNLLYLIYRQVSHLLE